MMHSGVGLPEESFQQLLEPDYRLRGLKLSEKEEVNKNPLSPEAVSQDCPSPVPWSVIWGEWIRDGE